MCSVVTCVSLTCNDVIEPQLHYRITNDRSLYYTSVLLKNQKITFGFTVRQRNKSQYYKQLSNSEIQTIYRKAKLSELYGKRWLTTSGWYITIYKPTLYTAY